MSREDEAMSEEFTPDRDYIVRMYVEHGMASTDLEYLGEYKMDDLLSNEINRGLDKLIGGGND